MEGKSQLYGNLLRRILTSEISLLACVVHVEPHLDVGQSLIQYVHDVALNLAQNHQLVSQYRR